MTTTELDVSTEDERIVRWRLERLRRAGYDDRQALEVALRTDVDLHLAERLLDRGCPAATALRILLQPMGEDVAKIDVDALWLREWAEQLVEAAWALLADEVRAEDAGDGDGRRSGR